MTDSDSRIHRDQWIRLAILLAILVLLLIAIAQFDPGQMFLEAGDKVIP